MRKNNLRRTKLEIIHDILREIGEEGTRPTHLMYKTNLSHALLKKYLERLSEQEMIIRVNSKEGTYITLTEKGEKQLKSIKRVSKTLNKLLRGD